MDFAAVGVLLVCVGTFCICRALRVGAAVPVALVLVVLLQTGAVSASAVPGVAQVADAKQSLDRWTDERTEAARRYHRQLSAHRQAVSGYEPELSP